jgi:transcriptional antiterminator
MNIDKLTSLIFLHELISKKSTGNPPTLAKQLNVSERTVYYYVEKLKNMGAPIVYSYLSESYIYTEDWKPVVLNYLWEQRKQSL